jgi:hypothetical protein
MDPILDAIAAIDAQEPGDKFLYRAAEKLFGVSKDTLQQRHQGKMRSNAMVAEDRKLLSPQQEIQPMQYIEKLTGRSIPPTQSIIKNYAVAVGKWEPGDAWVTRFLQQNKDHLTSKWSNNMDRNRHHADTEASYCDYFKVLQAKIQKYNVDAQDIYNMDEKGFAVGLTSKTKRIFSKMLFEEKRKTAGLQDGNWEWITILACICADGSEIDPAVIYAGKEDLCSGWVHNIKPGKHRSFCGTSPSVWTNNDLGLAWVEQVFDRLTKGKARTSYCLLILDGHGSHLTKDFSDFCHNNKILIMIFPPHSTHMLQPLDVVMFAPLARHYSTRLSEHLHGGQGLLHVKKGDFTDLFWPAYKASFTRSNILKAFEATGVNPDNSEVILKRFKATTSAQQEALQIGEPGDGDSYNDLQKLFDAAVPDKSKVEAQTAVNFAALSAGQQ